MNAVSCGTSVLKTYVMCAICVGGLRGKISGTRVGGGLSFALLVSWGVDASFASGRGPCANYVPYAAYIVELGGLVRVGHLGVGASDTARCSY